MSAFSTLLALINAQIKTNGLKAITGAKLNGVLVQMVNELGSGYQFIDIATPATDPGTPDENVWYIASQAGTYTNFGGIILNENEVCALVWNGSWTKKVTGAATAAQVSQLGQEIGEYDQKVFTSSDFSNLIYSSGSFVQYTGAWRSIIVKLTPGGKYKFTGTSVASVRTFNVEPEVGVSASAQHTYTVGTEFTAQSNDLYLYIEGNTNNGFAGGTLDACSGIMLALHELRDDVGSLDGRVDTLESSVDTIGDGEKKCEGNIGALGQETGFVVTTYTSKNYSGLIHDGTKFINATGAYQSVFVPLTAGKRYKVIGTAVSLETYGVQPALNLETPVVNRYNAGEIFTAQAGDVYLAIYGDTRPAAGFAGGTLIAYQDSGSNLNSKVINLDSRVDRLEEIVGDDENTQEYTSSDYSDLIVDNGVYIHYTSAWRAIYIKLHLGDIYKVTGNGITLKTFKETPSLNGTATRVAYHSVGVEFTAAENENYLEVSGNTNQTFSGCTLYTTSGIFLDIEQLDERVTGLENETYGNSIIGFGDSIMLLPYGGEQPTKYIAKELNCEVWNCGFGGTRWKPRTGLIEHAPTSTGEAWNALDLVNLVDTWINHPEYFNNLLDYIDDYRALFTPGINTLKTLRPTDVNVYMIMMGLNDFVHDTPLGTINDNDTTTICGCINHVITALLTANPNAKIYLFGNIVQWFGSDFTDLSNFSDTYTNGQGNKVQDMNEKIADCANKFKLPYCNLYNTMGWNTLNFSTYFTIDGERVNGSHPYRGVSMLGRKMGSYIKANKIF